MYLLTHNVRLIIENMTDASLYNVN